MDGSDDVARAVGQLLTSGKRPTEITWSGNQWDDGQLVYRVTVVDWPSKSEGGAVKVVVNCANRSATFGVPDGPPARVARYLDLSERQRSRGWSVYDGDPTRDPRVWSHLAWAARRVREAFDTREVHREYDGSFGLIVTRRWRDGA